MADTSIPEWDGHDDDSIEMHELEPSPVDEEAGLSISSSTDPSLPASTSASSTSQSKKPNFLAHSSAALGLHGHSTVYYLTRIQKYSSYTFTAFLAMHVTNTSLIPLLTRSVPASEQYLLLTRPYYQSSLAEPLVVFVPLAAHILSGMALRTYRRVHLARRYGADSSADRRRLAWPRLSGTSMLGYALAPFVLGHIFVNRVLPLWVDGSSAGIGLSYVGHGFAKDPATSFIGYTVLIAVASTHIIWGWAKWLAYAPEQTAGPPDARRATRRKRRWYTVNAVSALLAGLWLAGGIGIVGRGGEVRGWVGKGYDDLYRRIPLLGRWLYR